MSIDAPVDDFIVSGALASIIFTVEGKPLPPTKNILKKVSEHRNQDGHCDGFCEECIKIMITYKE